MPCQGRSRRRRGPTASLYGAWRSAKLGHWDRRLNATQSGNFKPLVFGEIHAAGNMLQELLERSLVSRPQGPVSSQRFYRKNFGTCWPWIGMSGEQYRGGNSPFALTMKRGDVQFGRSAADRRSGTLSPGSRRFLRMVSQAVVVQMQMIATACASNVFVGNYNVYKFSFLTERSQKTYIFHTYLCRHVLPDRWAASSSSPGCWFGPHFLKS